MRVTGLAVVSSALMDVVGRVVVRDLALAAPKSIVVDGTTPDSMVR